MQKNYILALFLFFVLIISTYFVTTTTDGYIVKVNENIESSTSIKKINKEEEKYIIKAYIPEAKTKEVNIKLENTYTDIISKFEETVQDLKLPEDNRKFSLNINFTEYTYNDYISFLITYSCDYGGAHPDIDVVTVNYNKKDKEFVDINKLIEKNKETLNIFSNISYESLKDKIEEKEDSNMLKQGTSPKKENFTKFVFSKEGVILFFPNYSVAPYYLGNFEVKVPYSKINI